MTDLVMFAVVLSVASVLTSSTCLYISLQNSRRITRLEESVEKAINMYDTAVALININFSSVHQCLEHHTHHICVDINSPMQKSIVGIDNTPTMRIPEPAKILFSSEYREAGKEA